jgi:cell division protein FtsN
MHFTFTDYIDGITKNGEGVRQGNSKNDKFMMSSVGLSYNFGIKKKEDKEEAPVLTDAEMLAVDMEDEDKDGVIDLKDECAGTPEGVAVDAKGCPLDDDGDGVPNYKDDEPNSSPGAYVDTKGVTVSDSLITRQYEMYMDSTGAFSPVESFEHNGRYGKSNVAQKEYSVMIGTFTKGLPPEMMTKFLSIKDINSSIINDSTTTYNAGKFNNLLDAEKRKRELVAMGLSNAKVVYKQNGLFVDAPAFVSNVLEKNPPTNEATTNASEKTNAEKENKLAEKTTAVNKKTAANNKTKPIENKISGPIKTSSDDVVLRVQLGAYSKRLSKSVFSDIDDLIEVKTEDGLYKYMTGSFNSFDQAAKRKVDMVMKGYEGAFITAYEGGKRITVQEAGATMSKKNNNVNEPLENESKGAVDKKLVVFRVQLGMFTSELPEDKRTTYAKIKGVEQVGTRSGAVRYVVGSFNDYTQAQEYKKLVTKDYGIEDAFLVAFFNNEIISVQEALELIK